MTDLIDGQVVIDSYPLRRWFIKGSTELPNYGVLTDFLVANYKTCYWCGIEVKKYPQIDGEQLPANTATLDHLTPRPDRKRHELAKKVLACRACNQRRGAESHKAIKR